MLDEKQHILSPEHPMLTIHLSSRIFIVRRRLQGDAWIVECVRIASAQVAASLVISGDACNATAHEPHLRHERDERVVWTFDDRHHPAGGPLLELVFERHCVVERVEET